MKTREGQDKQMVVQVGPVRKALISVARLNEAGNEVILGGKAYIRNLKTGSVTALRKSGRSFILDMWVKLPSLQTHDGGANAHTPAHFQRQ